MQMVEHPSTGIQAQLLYWLLLLNGRLLGLDATS